MAKTVDQAFAEFAKEFVDLDEEQTKRARSSRDWLESQLNGLADADPELPKLYPEKDIRFGSFARRTKIRPLDDIDLMVGLSAQGSTYDEDNGVVAIIVPQTAPTLRAYCHAGSDQLNSRRVINNLVLSLSKIHQYKKAEINRAGEAATLQLSYSWNFDIVPCFFTKPEADGRTYYLIPDGQGAWKKTDPRLDRDTLSSMSQAHNGQILRVIRLLKYWNSRHTAPKMPSYLLETMAVYYYKAELNSQRTASAWIDVEFLCLLTYLISAVRQPVWDLKEIQGDLNRLTTDQRNKIMQRAKYDRDLGLQARKYEDAKNHRAAIKNWSAVFGSDFPKYG